MKSKRITFLLCFLSAVIFITICSKSSFIYPINDWGDANCYFTLGKGMLYGKVPYRDFFEHKGIIIFTLYAIGALISKTSFIGIYFIEVLLMTSFLYVSLRIVSLFFENYEQYSLIIVFLLAGIICSSASFCHGGSPEELVLVLFAYGLYLSLKYFIKNECPNKKEMFIFGLFAGLLFFSKFTLCIIYISFILFMIIKSVMQKEIAKLFKNALMFILGCIIVTIPVILYFFINNSISDLIYVYFYKNIFGYKRDVTFSGISELLKHYMSYMQVFFRKRNAFLIMFILLGEIWLVIKKKYFIAIFQFFTFISYFWLNYIAMKPMKYYGLPFSILLVFGICATIDFLLSHKVKVNTFFKIAASALIILLAITLTDNRYLMFKSKNSTPQYTFAKEMASYNYKDYHMLYYGRLDEGFYFASNTLPNCKAFSTLNVQGDELKNMQKEHVNNRKCEFIVTSYVLCDSSQYEEYKNTYGSTYSVVSFDNFGYEQIDEMDYYFEEINFRMRLYKLK